MADYQLSFSRDATAKVAPGLLPLSDLPVHP